MENFWGTFTWDQPLEVVLNIKIVKITLIASKKAMPTELSTFFQYKEYRKIMKKNIYDYSVPGLMLSQI